MDWMQKVQRNGKTALAVTTFGCLLGLTSQASATQPVADWSLGMNFFFSNAAAPGGVSQDPLKLTLGVSSTSDGATKLKPPLPPGMAKTSNAGYPLVDAYVVKDGQRAFNVTQPADAVGRRAFTVKVLAEEANAKVSIEVDCSALFNLASGQMLTFNVVHVRTGKRSKITRDKCDATSRNLTLTDFVEVANPNEPEDVVVMGAPDGGGFVVKAGDKVVGAITSDNLAGDFAGAKVTIGGQNVTVNDEGVFTVTGLSGMQDVLVTRKGHLRRKVTVNLDNGEPVVFPKLAGGDANGDNKIDLRDLGILKQQFSQQTNCYNDLQSEESCGDANGDGVVDLKDLGILKQNFRLEGDN